MNGLNHRSLLHGQHFVAFCCLRGQPTVHYPRIYHTVTAETRPSEDNIANLASRRVSAWLVCSTFLHNCIHLPHSSSIVKPPDGVEFKKLKPAVNPAASWQLLQRYSDWPKRRSAMAWLVRSLSYIHNMHSASKKETVKVGNL